MPRISPIDPSTADDDARRLLDQVRKKLGGTPNMLTTLAHSPAATREIYVGKLIASVLMAVAEMERDTLLERQAAGIKAAKSKGVYGGISVDGSGVAVANAANYEYYEQAVRPTDILVKHSVFNPGSKSLRETAQKLLK